MQDIGLGGRGGGPGGGRPDAALGSLCLAVGLGARPSEPTVELRNALASVKKSSSRSLHRVTGRTK